MLAWSGSMAITPRALADMMPNPPQQPLWLGELQGFMKADAVQSGVHACEGYLGVTTMMYKGCDRGF